jgi:Right handed beta helix region
LFSMKPDHLLSRSCLLLLLALAIAFLPVFAGATVYEAKNSIEFKTLLNKLQPGDTLRVAPGEYDGGVEIRNLNGKGYALITIEGMEWGYPPLFKGGNDGIHLIDCNYVRLSNLKIQDTRCNGLNIDDGGIASMATPSTNIFLEGLVVQGAGGDGNNDAIKMSGVQHFRIQNCNLTGWGGSGIDMVGCAYGRVTGCRFTGKKGFRQANGVQIKGGSHTILVDRCYFWNAAKRVINLGGNTGLQYFRPHVVDFEAKNIEVAGNIFLGGGTTLAFVTSQHGFFHNNAILYPTGWVLRILQESNDPRFKPCGTGAFVRNIIVVAHGRFKTFMNIGRGTAPQSFLIAENLWYDMSGRRIPAFPIHESNGVYQLDPEVSGRNGAIRFLSKDPRLFGKGPAYYSRRRTTGP